MKEVAMVCALILTISAPAARGQSPSGGSIPVTVENFIRAESDLYISTVALKENGFGKFEHHRELSPIDAQTIIRMNRDTLYSAAVFDLRGTGDDHAAGCGQPFHVDAIGQSGRILPARHL
jgi:hypothetical protein